MNTKYISLSVLKLSEFSRVPSMSENTDVFISRDDIYLVFTEKNISLHFILFIGYMQWYTHWKKEVLKMQKRNILANPNNCVTLDN